MLRVMFFLSVVFLSTSSLASDESNTFYQEKELSKIDHIPISGLTEESTIDFSGTPESFVILKGQNCTTKNIEYTNGEGKIETCTFCRDKEASKKSSMVSLKKFVIKSVETKDAALILGLESPNAEKRSYILKCENALREVPDTLKYVYNIWKKLGILLTVKKLREAKVKEGQIPTNDDTNTVGQKEAKPKRTPTSQKK